MSLKKAMKKKLPKERSKRDLVFVENSGFYDDKQRLVTTAATEFSASELEKILKLFVSKNESMRDPFKLGFKTIKAQNMIGSIKLGSRKIEILPKFCKNNLENKRQYLSTISFMLSTVWNLNLSHYANSLVDTVDMNLQDLLSFLFVKELKHALSRGFPKNYVFKRESLSLIKGKVDFKRSIELHNGLLHKHVCSYEDYVSEHPLKCFVKATLESQLIKTKSPVVLSHLMSSLASFKKVKHKTFTESEIEALNIPRGFEHLRATVVLAKILYLNQNILQQKAKTSSSSFLFSMPNLFERFIGKFLKSNAEAFNLSAVHLQKSLPIFEKSIDSAFDPKSFYARPDIVLKTKYGQEIIIDTKYKDLEKDKKSSKIQPSTADINQINSYVSRFNLSAQNRKPIGVLLYPNSHRDICLQLKGLGGFSSVFIVSIGLGDDYKSSKKLLKEKFCKIFSDIEKVAA